MTTQNINNLILCHILCTPPVMLAKSANQLPPTPQKRKNKQTKNKITKHKTKTKQNKQNRKRNKKTKIVGIKCHNYVMVHICLKSKLI